MTWNKTSVNCVLLRIIPVAIILCLSFNMLSQAANDTENNAYDYIPRLGDVSENDILPEGSRVHRFLNEPFHGTIEWIDESGGIFSYLVNPLNVQIYAGGGIWAYGAPYTIRLDSIYYEVCTPTLCDTALIEIFIGFNPDNPVAVPDTFYIETGSLRTFDVSWNDYDPDSISDPNRYPNRFYDQSLPQFATSEAASNNPFMSQDGHFQYQSQPSFAGEDSFTYVMLDPLGCVDSSEIVTVTIMVLENDASPFASQVNLGNINEESIRYQNLAFYTFDPEGESLTYRIIQQGQGGVATVTSIGALTYTAALDYIGPDTLYYQVTDLVGQTDTAAIVLQIINANNDAPLAPDRTFDLVEDAVLSQNIDFLDLVDGDALSYSIETNAQHGMASVSASGLLTYTPNPNFFGTDIIHYTSCDAGNLCDIASIEVFITPVNDAPTVTSDFNELPINGTLTSNLLPNVSDPDSQLSSITFSMLDSPSHGTIVLQSNGAYTYIPDAFFYGEDSFTYSACDNAEGCSVGSVELTITLVNLPPEAQNTTFSLQEDESTIINLEEFTYDFGSSDLYYDVINPPAIGQFNSITNSGISFDPSANVNGSFTINYKVCDTGNLCDTAQISLNIVAVNDSPVAIAGVFEGSEDMSIAWSPNYTDIDNDSLQAAVINAPLHGTINGNAYLPQSDFFGTDSLSFEVCDAWGACSIATIVFVISEVNDAPIASDASLTGSEDQWIENNLADHTYDIDSSNLNYSAIPESNPDNIQINLDGTLLWLPPANFFGTTSVAYSVCDNDGLCDTAWAYISIEELNDTPFVNFPVIQLQEDSEIDYTSLYYAYDIEGQNLSQSIISAIDVEAELNNVSGVLHITASYNYSGDAYVVLNTCDDFGACVSDTIHIDILPVNDSPFGNDFSYTTFQNTPITASLYDHATDVDDDILSFNVTTSFGVTTIENGMFNFAPQNGFVGTDTLQIQACDSSLSCINLTGLIHVLSPNQPPVVQELTEHICQNNELLIPLNAIASDEVDTAENLQYTFNASAPATFTIDAENQTLTILPSTFFFGELSIEVNVCDNATPPLCTTGNITLTVTATSSPQITAATIHQITCFGNDDGSIVIENVAEETGVEYLWSDGTSSNGIDSLHPGNYEVEITGLSACSTPLQALFTITEPEVLQLALTSQAISSPGSGLIESNITGGTQPYSYTWQGPNNFSSTEPTLQNLNTAGSYTLVVNDANGCLSEETIMLTPIVDVSAFEFNIYPNPTVGRVHICVPSDVTAGTNLRIIDAFGREVLRKTTERPNELIMLDFLSAGIYRVLIDAETREYQSSIIVTK